MGVVENTPGALQELRRRIQYLTTAGFGTELSQVLGAAALKEVADEFRNERDPYGNRWKKPVLRNGQALSDTPGGMRNSAAVAPRQNGFRLTITKHYAGTHQRGATILPVRARHLRFRTRDGRWFSLYRAVIPRRQIVPERQTGGLGPIWGAAFNRDAGSLIRRRLQGAA